MNFQELGRVVDVQLANLREWFGAQPDAQRLLVAGLVGALIAALLVSFERWIFRSLTSALRFSKKLRKQIELPLELPVPTEPEVRECHYHDPLARYGVISNGVECRMVPLPQQLAGEIRPEASWRLVNVDWITAVAYIVLHGRNADLDLILPPPPLQSKAVEDETLKAPELVYVTINRGSLELIPATVELADNATLGTLRVLGNKLLRSSGECLVELIETRSIGA